MDKSTFRLLVVILLGVLVAFVAFGYFKIINPKTDDIVEAQDDDSNGLKNPKGLHGSLLRLGESLLRSA